MTVPLFSHCEWTLSVVEVEMKQSFCYELPTNRLLRRTLLVMTVYFSRHCERSEVISKLLVLNKQIASLVPRSKLRIISSLQQFI